MDHSPRILFSLAAVAAIYILTTGVRVVSKWIVASIGVVGFLSQMLVLISLQFFVAAGTTTDTVTDSHDHDTDINGSVFIIYTTNSSQVFYIY